MSSISRLSMPTNSISAPASSIAEGIRSKPVAARGDHRIARIARADEHVVDGQPIPMTATETAAGVALRIDVHQQHPLAQLRHTRAQVDRRRRLAHAALLICHRNDLAHAPSPVFQRLPFHYKALRGATQAPKFEECVTFPVAGRAGRIWVSMPVTARVCREFPEKATFHADSRAAARGIYPMDAWRARPRSG